MSTKFFANDNENTFLTKIKGIIEHKNIHFFDMPAEYLGHRAIFKCALL